MTALPEGASELPAPGAALILQVEVLNARDDRVAYRGWDAARLSDTAGEVYRLRPRAEKSAGGIILPDNAKEKPREGKVVAVGNGKLMKNGERSKFQVAKGDRIIFSSYAGTEVKLDGEEYLVIRESDLLAIVTNGKK